MTGEDDKIAFCLTHGAYYVESNMGSKAIFTNSDDNTMTHRSSAASAEFSREMAQKVYGYEHRPTDMFTAEAAEDTARSHVLRIRMHLTAARRM